MEKFFVIKDLLKNEYFNGEICRSEAEFTEDIVEAYNYPSEEDALEDLKSLLLHSNIGPALYITIIKVYH